ncbi:hypothetical protein FB192DRAFT_1387417 [Mucor lusitanicus]|uniref:EKC/KEOPS complex subunit GON7 n=2 Tax=Mucor circinelloides f. lusitanicus TaxID=29924 RepID=A0A168N983_MUCCL|nr:hypothetical protein FB192DRAFT_1387417 [Mucor lusitanicus]OAD05973.1 hypothetical protein MUCCIDRAFT_106534 [Mucor lusitanicus CBS 277.49]
MSSLTATYNNTTKNTSKVIQVPLDSSTSLTDNILNLKEQVNTFLTQTLEQEKQSKVTSVEEDEIEKQKQEEQAGEDEEEQDQDSPMTVDKPELVEQQASKKLKTDP